MGRSTRAAIWASMNCCAAAGRASCTGAICSRRTSREGEGMSRRMRTYYDAVLGAMGGLIGWQVSNALGLSFIPSLVASEAIVGGLIGLSVGALIGACEGLLSRNWARAARAARGGGRLGGGGGA